MIRVTTPVDSLLINWDIHQIIIEFHDHDLIILEIGVKK